MPSASLVHERVAVVRRRDERLLDRARRRPADQVPHRARLVVRTRGASAAERLLADDGASRLVVDVEVPGRMTEVVTRLLNGSPILRPDGAGEAVGSSVVDDIERLAPALLVVDERRHDGPEELVAQEPEARIARLDHGWLDEVA